MVITVVELFPGTGSVDVAATVAVFDSVPDVCGTTAIAIDGAAPTGNVAAVHVTVVVPVHDHPVPVADDNTTVAGSVSVTVTPEAALGPALVTSIVYVSVWPAVTGSGASVIAIARSFESVTVVVVVAELLPGTGSAVAVDTVAVFASVVACDGAVATIAIAGAAPLASEARVHVTVVVPLHAQPVPVADTKVMPAGRVSTTESEVAVLGPALLTLIVNVTLLDATAGSGASVIAIDTSDEAVTAVVVEAVLFALSGSGVVEAIAAVVVIVPPAAGAFAVTVIAGAAPVASVARVHVTVGDTKPHVQPVPLAITLVTPAGIVTVAVSDEAAFGPALLTVAVNVIAAPATTGSGASVSAIDRSAAAFTVVVWVAVLFAVLASFVAAETFAVVEIVPLVAGAVRLTVIAGAAPVASVEAVHVTVGAANVHDQPVPLAPVNVAPAGIESVTVTVDAALGPALLTVIV